MIIMFTVFSIAVAVLDAHAASGSPEPLVPPVAPVAPLDPSSGMMLPLPPEDEPFPDPPLEVLPPFSAAPLPGLVPPDPLAAPPPLPGEPSPRSFPGGALLHEYPAAPSAATKIPKDRSVYFFTRPPP
jgi:hypothetical protein